MKNCTPRAYGFSATTTRACQKNAAKQIIEASRRLIRIGNDVMPIGVAAERLGCSLKSLRAELRSNPTWETLCEKYKNNTNHTNKHTAAPPARSDNPEDVFIPIKTAPGLNSREHYMARANRAKRERTAAWTMTVTKAKQTPLPVVVTLTRLSAGVLDDDNLAGACKGIRDGIADAFGVDDGGNLIEWRYSQRKCAKGTFGVIVHIAPITP